MLPLHDVAFDGVKRSGRRGKTCNPLMKTLTPPLQKNVLNDVNYQKMTSNIYSYIIKGLSH